jgi:hypothetical protein
MHIEKGLLMAFVDRELPDGQRKEVESHLRRCETCRDRLAQIEDIHGSVSEWFAGLSEDQRPASFAAARERLQERIIAETEMKTMWTSVFSRKYRPVWASLMVIVVVVMALAAPPVRALAGRLLQLFRAQEVRTVYVDTDKVKQQMDKLRTSSDLEKLLASTVKVDSQGEPETIQSPTAAGAQAGIEVRLPKRLGAPVKTLLMPASEVSMQVDRDRVQAILDDLGRSDVELPASLDGATINVSIPRAVVSFFGECGPSGGSSPEEVNQEVNQSRDCTVLYQVMSPTVTAPAGLDLNRTAAAMLQVLGMSKEEAEEFAGSVDWTSTLIMPVPRQITSAETVMVDGVKGSLITQNRRQTAPRFMLVWIKGEIIYSLSGFGSKEDALAIAGSLS